MNVPASESARRITKTCLYNFDSLKPHFYIVKLGFLFLLKIDCVYSLEPPSEAVLTSTHNLCFEQKYEKYQNFLFENFQFLVVKFSVYFNRRVFLMDRSEPCYMSTRFTITLSVDSEVPGQCAQMPG